MRELYLELAHHLVLSHQILTDLLFFVILHVDFYTQSDRQNQRQNLEEEIRDSADDDCFEIQFRIYSLFNDSVRTSRHTVKLV